MAKGKFGVKASETALPGVLLLEAERHGDERGFLSEVWNRKALAAAGIRRDFVQDNHARSAERFTFRGLHFQLPPHDQAKLVRVSRGAVLDLVVDVRRGSETFGRHLAVVLSEQAWNQLYVPEGFAHGYLTLEPDSEVLYKVTDYYAPAAERGLNYADPALGIAWPVPPEAMRVNDRDRGFPRLAELPGDLFRAGGGAD